jgi:hypothetical protein
MPQVVQPERPTSTEAVRLWVVTESRRRGLLFEVGDGLGVVLSQFDAARVSDTFDTDYRIALLLFPNRPYVY